MEISPTPPSLYEVFLQRLDNAKRLLYGAFKARTSGTENRGDWFMRGKVCFELKGKAVFGKRFWADGHAAKVCVTVHRGATLTVGDQFAMNYGATVEAWHEIRIGTNVKIGPYSTIIDDDRHEIEPGAILYKGPVVLGNNIWLTRNVMVMPGVSIGDGCVIGANSVVTKDIPPNSFAVGAPARVIRKLELPDGWMRS